MKPSRVLCLLLASTVLLLLAVFAFQPAGVNTEFDLQRDFAGANTFTILPLPKEIPGADPDLSLRVGGAVSDRVRAALTAKGYTEAANQSAADIAILIHGKLVPKTEVTNLEFTPTIAAYSWNRGFRGYFGDVYDGGNVSADQYDEGTLIAEVYDVGSQNMIWVGWLPPRTHPEREGGAERITEDVDRLLGFYPAMRAKSTDIAMEE